MKSIQNVAVIGLGTMGHGIAQAYAAAGLRVYAFDEVAAARTSLHARVRQNLQQFVRAGLATKRSVEPTLKRIVVCDTLEAAVREAQFVTETVREDLKTKQELLAKLEGMVGPQTILASNSSTFPISASGARLRRPGRAIVTHWFNPPHIVPTVEVVPGRRTSAATTRAALALLTRVGKQAIHLRKEVPGFLVNRIQIAMTREVWSMLDEGVASVDDIDRAIRGSLGFRLAAIGPLEVADFGGLDIHARVFNNLAPEICSGTRLSPTVAKLVKAGHFGAKTGRGFYSYAPRELEARRTRRDRRFLALLKLLHARAGAA